MEWQLISENRVDGGTRLTIDVSGYTLVTVLPDGPGREQKIEAYVQRASSFIAVNELRRAAAPKTYDDISSTTTGKCGGCGGGGKRTIGVVSMLGAMIGGKATPDTAAQRLAICEDCQHTDATGERLYRVIDGKVYCGVPRLADVTKILRDESKIGCGCELHDKVQWRKASCPNNRWGAEEAVEP